MLNYDELLEIESNKYILTVELGDIGRRVMFNNSQNNNLFEDNKKNDTDYSLTHLWMEQAVEMYKNHYEKKEDE